MSRSMLLSVDELLTITLSLQYSIDCQWPRSDPSLCKRPHLISLALAVDLRPLYFPSLFALAIPALWRSNISRRSNSAKAANMPGRIKVPTWEAGTESCAA